MTTVLKFSVGVRAQLELKLSLTTKLIEIYGILKYYHARNLSNEFE
jgi:hypothetical protein